MESSPKNAFFRDITKHYLCLDSLEGEEKGIFVNTICFGTIALLDVFGKKQKALQKQGFQQTQGKTKRSPFVVKKVFLEEVAKGLLLSVIHKSCVLLKALLCFHQNTAFAEKRVKVAKKGNIRKIVDFV